MSARNARSGPRIAILGFYLESNAFAPVTTAADFHADCYLEGDDILIEAAKNAPVIPSEIPGFIKGMNATGAWQPLPVVVAAAHPGGRVDQAFFEATMTRMNRLLAAAQPVDAVYIFSHGAMVATDVPGCREVCRAGETGLLVPARSVAPLADALEKLTRDAALRRGLGMRARQVAEAEFAEAIVIAETLALYRKLTAASRSR